jgi:hypothetical protein
MQTFLPYKSFTKSAEALDSKRLGKQRLEAKQILNVLLNDSTGWRNHPIVKMWRGYEPALNEYLRACIEEWKKRGYKNTMSPFPMRSKIVHPPWLGNRKFHLSHRSNLLRKNSGHYSQFHWHVPPDLPYLWFIDNEWTIIERKK